MRIVLALYGPPSPVRIEYPPEITIFKVTPSSVDPDELATARGNAHHSQRGNVTLQYYQDHLQTALRASSVTFDIIIYTTCKTLFLSWPTVPGTYHSDMLDAVELVSDTHVRHRGQIYSWRDFPDQPRLLKALFKNKVADFHVRYPSSDADITFIIPSVINCSASPFHYAFNRSLFTPQERLEQTCEQLQSIQKYVPDAHSYLVEGSILTLSQLQRLTDVGGDKTTVVLFDHDVTGFEYANTNGNKSLYELYVLQQLLLRVSSKWYFKFGGRYQMMKFNRDELCGKHAAYKIIDKRNNFTPNNIIECILYSFPDTIKYKQMHMYKQCIDYILQHPSENVESILYKHISQPDYTYTTVPALNVWGQDAICGYDNLV